MSCPRSTASTESAAICPRAPHASPPYAREPSTCPHSARSGNRASCASGAPVVGARIKRRHRPERPRYSRPPTRLSASPVQETGLAVLDQLTPGQLAQADIEHWRQEQAEQGAPDHAGEHGDAGRRAHLGAGAAREHQRDRAGDEGPRSHHDGPQLQPASRTETGNTSSVALPWVASWKLRSVHSMVMPLGNTRLASSAIVAIACAEDSMAGLASPMKSAAG